MIRPTLISPETRINTLLILNAIFHSKCHVVLFGILDDRYSYTNWLCGAMDNASDYESGDCRFDPCQSRTFFWMSDILDFWGLFIYELSNKITKTLVDQFVEIAKEKSN